MTAPVVPAAPAGAPIAQKLLVRFAKRDALRFLSHHDLMRLFQRAAARAGLPVRRTAGFNQRPRLVFPQALELGVESLDEAVELELAAWVAPLEVRRRLAAALPAGLPVGEVSLLPPRRKGLQAVEAAYRIELDSLPDLAVTPAALARFLAAETVTVLRRRAGGGGLAPSPTELDADDETTTRTPGGRPGSPPETAEDLIPDSPPGVPGGLSGALVVDSPKALNVRPAVRELTLAADGRRLDLRLGLARPPVPRPTEVLAGLLGRPVEELTGLRVIKTALRLAPAG